ncbi:MAG: LapA family protein [Kistimonas sp.]|nr:LapA family protein [Kistimonas sp.]
MSGFLFEQVVAVRFLLRCKGYVLFALVLAVCFAGFLPNRQLVSISFWHYVFEQCSVSFALFIAFLSGALFGVIYGSFAILALKIRNRRLRRTLRQHENVIERLQVRALRELVP